MDVKYSYIPDIAVGSTETSCKVVVIEKMSPRTAQRGTSKYQHVWLMDAQSNKIQATIFDDVNIRALQNTLILFKTYGLSRFKVRSTNERMQSSVGSTQWILSGSSRIVEIQEDFSLMAETHYVFTPFHDLHALIGSDREIGVAGVVVDVGPIREVHNNWSSSSKALNVVLLDERLQALTLTLWDSLAENEGAQLADILMKRTLLVANHLKVTTYNGISLSTKTASSLLINPTLQKLHRLRNWIDTSTEILLHTITTKDYVFIKSTLTSSTSHNESVEIRHVLEHLQSYPEGTKFWIHTTISLKNSTSPLYYLACSICTKGASADLGEVYTCNYCTHDDAVCVPRARCDVEVNDDTGTLLASIIGPIAEQYLGTTSQKLVNVDPDKYSSPVNNYHSKYAATKHSVYMKSGLPDPKSGDPRFNITHITENSDATPPPAQVSTDNSNKTALSNYANSSDDPNNEPLSAKRSLQFTSEDHIHPKNRMKHGTNEVTQQKDSPVSPTHTKL